MSKKNEIYDVSAELAREFGEIGTQSRAEATAKAASILSLSNAIILLPDISIL